MPDKPDNPINFWQELKRRKVIRVIIVYATAAFVLIELVTDVSEPLGLPEWIPTAVIVLLAVGFPLAIIFSWIFDVTPEGIVKTEPAKVAKEKEAEAKPAKRKLRVSDVIIAVLIVVIGILAYPKIFQKDEFEDITEKSIAVLPFEDMSPQKDQEYFCDGMAEEIINALTHVEGLKVIARTSAFSFPYFI